MEFQGRRLNYRQRLRRRSLCRELAQDADFPHRAARRQDQCDLRRDFDAASIAPDRRTARARGETRPLLGFPDGEGILQRRGLPTTWGFPAAEGFTRGRRAVDFPRQAGAAWSSQDQRAGRARRWQSYN